MNDLAKRHCKPLKNIPPMTQTEIASHLAEAKRWKLADGAIERRFKFDDFHATMGFVNVVAWIANREDHHPELAVSYGECVVRFNTHSVGGISINDFICAVKIDVLVDGAT